MPREFGTVGVVGLGTMGAGIAEVLARSGLNVIASEVDSGALERGRATLTRSVDRAVDRGRLSPQDREALLSRVRFTVGLGDLSAAELVIEAVPERMDLKRQVFAELGRICPPETVLATNTSSLSVTEIAVASGRPDRVAGLHFFNPAPVMRLVEVVRTVVTADDVVEDLAALCARLGKVDVHVTDRAGFVANWLLFGYLNRAVAMLEQGYATREDIDTAMTVGARLPMGPLTLLDLIGLDTACQILDTMYERGGRDRRHAAAPLLRQLVTAGLLGRKSGRGFYTYERPGSGVVVPDGAAGASDEQAARPVALVGVVGAGPVADRLSGLAAPEGCRTVAVAGPGHPGWEELSDAGLVVVADPTAELLAEVGRACGPEAVLAVAVPAAGAADRGAGDGGAGAGAAGGTAVVTALARETGRPGDVVGVHLVDPESPLVEVVRTVLTSPAAVATARAALGRLGLTPVVCPDRAGFLVDALRLPYLNDAVRMREVGYASARDIDTAMKLGCGYPAGPFEELERLGPATVLAGLRALHREEPEPGLAPSPLLEQLVTAGRPVTAA
ncbi:MAG: 3-hydroxybutyryl-CoA dehydrogenase [Micromonosporaceae bacterium]